MTTLASYTDPATSSTLPKLAKSYRQSFLVVDGRLRIIHASGSVKVRLGVPATVKLEGLDLSALFTEAAKNSSLSRIAVGAWLETSLACSLEDSIAPLVLQAYDGTTVEARIYLLDDHYRIVSLQNTTVADSNADDILRIPVIKDHLTGIGNRAFFESSLDEASVRLEAGALDSAAVLFLDLDRFKIVNDTLGHAVGDDLLRLVSDRLQKELKGAGTLARMGGDEFAILLSPAPQETAIIAMAIRLIDLLQRTYLIEGHVVHVGVSIGIAVAPSDGFSRKLLLKRADLALYESKIRGRGLFHFFKPVMEEKAENRRMMEMDLRKALVLRQFEVYYQPQIDVVSRAITGLEGLLRWRHPSRGVLLPADFIPLAEEIGITIPIGEWVLKTICNEAKRWPDNITIAMNVSPHQFERNDFASSIQRALTGAGIMGHRIEIELTEDILLRNNPLVPSILLQLRELGVKVALDGFGTGVASLSQLVKIAFDKIKIDRSLIAMQGGGIRNRAIVRAISALGNTLGIKTLAEGVESTEHLAYVQSEGCQSVQGFFYSQAVPASDLKQLFSRFPPASITHSPEVSA